MGRKKIVAVSGGFDPLHIGHIDYFKAAKKLGDKLVVILNSDEFLLKKKGYIFMPLKERKKIVEHIKYVDETVVSIDNDHSVRRTLKKLKPDIFANGGDRTLGNIPEKELCSELGIEMAFGVGKRKIQSSSWLLSKFRKPESILRPWGYYIVLEEGKGYKVKRIIIYPKKRLSLQIHKKRSEHWVVIRGKAKAIVGKKEIILRKNESCFVPKETIHRLENLTKKPTEIIEVQNGDYLKEDDIIRLEDDYKRLAKNKFPVS